MIKKIVCLLIGHNIVYRNLGNWDQRDCDRCGKEMGRVARIEAPWVPIDKYRYKIAEHEREIQYMERELRQSRDLRMHLSQKALSEEAARMVADKRLDEVWEHYTHLCDKLGVKTV